MRKASEVRQMKKYTIGVDFGTLSARAVLVETGTGRETASAVAEYAHGVMDTTLADGTPLPPQFALQDPADYLHALDAVLHEVFAASGVTPAEVAGLGVDFTCCTLLPVLADGTPLCFLPQYKSEPHAYVKLWKHHAAQPYADKINQLARERGEKWLAGYGGAINSEWMFPKIYEVLDRAPEIYEKAAYFIEAGDWITWMLTDQQVRGYVYAAYKGIYDIETGYPGEDFWGALDPRLAHVVSEKLNAPLAGIGERVGEVTPMAAEQFGLAAGTPVAAALPDAHCAAPALGVTRPGDLYAIFGTSACFFLLGDRDVAVPGICGTVRDGVLPGFYGYEAGLCCLGDHFAYAAERLTSRACVKEAEEKNISMLRLLLAKAAALAPGESGVLALNWFNGNRNVLMNAELSGLFVGLTLATKPEHLMRALLEATAFGTRMIFDALEGAGLPICRVTASGGIARKDPFFMQLYADILGKELRVSGTAQGPAQGTAISAAVAAGVYPDHAAAMEKMCHLSDIVYHPNPQNTPTYDELYEKYRTLHDYFGRGGNPVMSELKTLARRAKENQN